MDNTDLIGFEFEVEGWPAVVTGPVSWGETYMAVEVTKAYPVVQKTCCSVALLRAAKIREESLVLAEGSDVSGDGGSGTAIGSLES